MDVNSREDSADKKPQELVYKEGNLDLPEFLKRNGYQEPKEVKDKVVL